MATAAARGSASGQKGLDDEVCEKCVRGLGSAGGVEGVAVTVRRDRACPHRQGRGMRGAGGVHGNRREGWSDREKSCSANVETIDEFNGRSQEVCAACA